MLPLGGRMGRGTVHESHTSASDGRNTSPAAVLKSRNLCPDGSMLPLGGRMGQGTLHESHASASSNTSPAAVLKSHSILPGNAAVAINFNSALPRNASSTSVLRSSWIQRLKPFSQTYSLEREPPNPAKKENPVCTHFTKDFKSCSRRLDKSSYHARSSSWPPHGAQFEGEGHTSMEPGEPADITEGFDEAGVNPPDIGHQSSCFASKTIAYSRDTSSGTGNLFAQQHNSCTQISVLKGFVPCARNREISSLEKLIDLQGRKNGDDGEAKDGIAQQFMNRTRYITKDDSVAACDVSQQIISFIQPEEVCNKWEHCNGASASVKGDVHSHVLSVSAHWAPHGSDVNADADDRKFFVKPLDFCMIKKKEPLQTPFSKTDCEIAFPTDKFCEDRPLRREVGRNCLFMGSEDAEDLDGRNFKQFKETVEKSYLFKGISNAGASRKFDLSQRNRHLADTFGKVHEGDVITACVVNSTTIPTPVTLNQDDVSKKLDAFCQRENNLGELQDPHFSEGRRISRSSLPIGSWNEDAARSRIREISLGEYWDSWVRQLEESDYVRPAKIDHSTASLHQDFVVGEYKKNLFQLPSSKLRLDARQKIEDYHSCSPHNLVKDDAENLGSCDFPHQMLASSSNNFHKFSGHRISSSQTKTGQGQELCASADQISHFRLKYLQDSQEEDLCFHKGITGRVDSQPHNEDAGLHTRVLDDSGSYSRMDSTHLSHEFCNNEKTGKGCSMHQGWMQRWHCSAGMSGKALAFLPSLSRGSSSDQLVKLPESCSGSAQCALACSDRAMGSFVLNLVNSGRGSNRCTEASGTHLDSCSASTPDSLLMGRNFAAFRSGYRGSCIKGVAIACKSASKLHRTSLQNRGFCGLPCSSPKSLECKVLPEDGQGTNDKKTHSVDLDDLKVLKRHMDDL